MSSPSPPSSTTPSTPNPSPPDDPQPSFSGSLQPLPSLPAPQPQHYSSASASRSSSTHRSRSPSSRNDLQTLLRTGGHLSLTASLSEQGSSTSGNPLRRPVDVIPAGTEGLAMPSMDSFLATKDAKAGLGIAGVGGERLGEEAAASTYHPRFAGSPSSNMRRTSSASSTATITQLSRTSSNPSFPPSSSSAASTTYPPASYTIGLGSGAPSLSSAGLSPGPRAHIRTQGVRQPPSSPRPPSSRPESPFKPLSTSLPTTGVSTSASTPPDSPNPTAPSTIFLPSQPSSRKPSVSAGILVRRDSFVGLEGSEEALSMVDSPVGTPGARRTSVEQELLEATRRLEISEATGAAAGEIEIQGASSAQAFNDSLSPRSKFASTSLPPLPTPGGTGALSHHDSWDWDSFIEAYRDGRWDPYKIPNPPESFSSMASRRSAPVAPVKLPHRPGSSSAPSSSSATTAPRTRTPPPTSSTRTPLLSNSSAAFQREAQPYSSSSANYKVPTPRSPLSAPVALPSPSLAAVTSSLSRPTLKSTPSPSGIPQPRSKPFMANAEFAATVRLAGSSSNLAPFALPSPEHEHVDPLRAYAAPGSNTIIQSNSINFSQPGKSKSGQMIGGSWTVSSGGLLPSSSSSAQPTRLEVIPGTPASENAPSGVSGNGNGYLFPMATAPAERRRGSTDVASEEDYFGGASGNWKPAQIPPLPSTSLRESLSADDGPGSGDSTRTVVGRGVSYSGPNQSSTSNGSYSPASTIYGAAGMARTGITADISLNEFLTQPLTPGGNYFSSSNPPPLPSPLDLSPHSRPDSGSDSAAESSSSKRWNQNGLSQPQTPEEQTFLKKGWLPAPLPANEKERRRALYRFDILHSGPDHNFDRISHLAKLVFSTKMVLISMVDEKEQWFKSESGFGCSSGPRDSSFCGHVLLQKSDEPVVVLDALKDWRFEKNPLVVGPPHIRFYAGSPLRTSDGFNIGSLCVLDDKPRAELSPRQRHALKEFAAIVMRELELWRDKLHLRRRGMIQDSMEKFTRDTVEMDVSALSVDQAMDKVYQQAAQLVQKTLDVDGALVLDLSAFELVEIPSQDGLSTDFHYQADPYQIDASTTNGAGAGEDGEETPGKENPPFLARASSFGPIPGMQILGSSELVATPESRSKLVSGVEHHTLAEWLKEYPDGKIYEKVVPSWFRHMLPSSGLAFVMLVPIFNIDRNPFAMICAYTCEAQKEFLEGYELKYLRAIGLIILSAVLKRRLTLADKAKANFISNISHELRTPLHGILISSELLAETKLTTQQSSYLDTVQACGNSLIETVNHVLDFTKLSGNSSRTKGTSSKSIETTEVDLVKLIEETVEGCWIGQRAREVVDDQSRIGSFYSPASPSSPVSSLFTPDNKTGLPTDLVECVIDVGLRKSGWKIKCEKGGIRRVLMNLLGNSLKFTKDGYVQVILRELPSLPGSSLIPIELAVIDTGKGISREFLKDQLFQPFSQENPLQTGTGLGLAIVNSIVSSESVKGKVDVWSSEGLGTEIKVSFSAEPGREVVRGEPLSDEGIGYGLSVSPIGFFAEHRGLKLAQDILEGYLEDWGFDIRDETQPGWGDLLFINEDHSIIDVFTAQRNTSRPIILYASARGSGPQSNSVAAYVAAGGFAMILAKPAGPIKLEAAFKSAVNFINGGRRGSGSSSSGSSRRGGVARSDSGHRPRSRTPSEPGSFDYPSPSHSVSHSGPAAEITYFSPHNGTHGLIASAAHQLSPTHYLQRRRSEEEREPRRRAKRPQMAPRSITYQPDTASPLAHEGYPLAHLTGRRMSANRHEEDEDEQPPTPNSPASVVSLADGGSVLRSATVLDEAEARSYGPKACTCLVVEDNPINRRVLAAFLQKKKFTYVEAVNGQEGVDVFRAQKEGYFDVILCDLSMPVLDGFGATQKIREIEKARRTSSSSPTLPASRVTILALTGLATPEDKRRAFGSGVDGYLVKPVSLKTLDSVFKKLGFGL